MCKYKKLGIHKLNITKQPLHNKAMVLIIRFLLEFQGTNIAKD